MQRSRLIFHPLPVSAFALLGVLGYAVLVRWRFPGGDLSHHYMYVLPIIFPFVAFLFDRVRSFRESTALQSIVDVLVVGISLLRGLGLVPLISGHALFLTYACAGPGSRLTRISAAIVMLQVIYLKFFVWHDPVSPVTGAVLALIGALVVWRQKRQANFAASAVAS